MILSNTIYFQLIYSYLYYIEGCTFYFCSRSNSRKIRRSFKYLFIIRNNEMLKKINLFSNKYLSHNYLYFKNSLMINSQVNFFKDSFYDNKGKLKVVGRGWKIIKYAYQLLIKLGYSHPIFNVINPLIKYRLKKKKKKYYIFYGVFNNHINTLISKFSFMRRPDVYTSKGIFNRRVIL